jgi:hypothetical protein
MSPKDDDLWFEIGKGGITLALATVVGFLRTAVLKDLDARREARTKAVAAAQEEERRRHERRLAMLHDVILAYDQVKLVRRMLRTLGFEQPAPGLAQGQVDGFVSQMTALQSVELALEVAERQVDVSRDDYGPEGEELYQTLRLMDGYVRKVLKEWEDRPHQVAVDGQPPAADKGWPEFASFFGSDEDSIAILRRNIADPMREVERLVRKADELPTPKSRPSSRVRGRDRRPIGACEPVRFACE